MKYFLNALKTFKIDTIYNISYNLFFDIFFFRSIFKVFQGFFIKNFIFA
jgi:hypothetical protein